MIKQSVTELAGAAWPELPSSDVVLLVPLGSTEQHGPHLPAGTDSTIADAVARAAAELAVVPGPVAVPGSVVVAPALPYGASGEHQHFPGTVSIGHQALALLLLELGRSAFTWAARAVFVNGHGGNLPTVSDVVVRLRSEGRDAAWVPCSRPGVDAHAGAFETSVMLALDPSAVRLEAARPGAVEPVADLLPALRAGGVRAVSENGVLGDPTSADAETGRLAVHAMAADVASRLARWDVAPATGLLRA